MELLYARHGFVLDIEPLLWNGSTNIMGWLRQIQHKSMTHWKIKYFGR
jgi:hypothetical protein